MSDEVETGALREARAKLADVRRALDAAVRGERRERAMHEMTLTALKVRLSRTLEEPRTADEHATFLRELLDNATLALSVMIGARRASSAPKMKL